MRLTVAVRGLAQWSYGDVDPPLVLAEGQHELDNPSSELVAALAAAAAAGVGVELVEVDADARAIAKNAVEKDTVSLKRGPELVAAMDDDARAAWNDFLKAAG